VPEPTDIGRSARKRHAIAEAAQSVFLSKGYAGTTMDDVAALASVSKQTVYKHFADKQRLFEAIITGEIAATAAATHDLVEALGVSDDLASDLRRFARQHIVDVTQPHLLRLRRIVISEAEQFPDLARAWYAAGPERGHATLAAQLAALADRRLLSFDDALLAAEHLNWLIIGIPLNRSLYHGADAGFTRKQLHRYADEAVRVFLAAYGT
jgi:TetR/AcrR family transcriptional regulator, mexJK operon transcriptional repressor